MIRDNYLDISRITTDPNVLKIFKIVSRHGGAVRFVGGAVRDALAGCSASNLDLSTDLSPDELAEACEDAGVRTVPVGLKIDTLGVLINGTLLEISSLKKQIKTGSGHIEVEFTDDWQADAAQRDLTINAVYADEKGNVFDYYNGIEDLEKGVVRFIGDPNRQIREDYVRILRFFRFYSLFGKAPIDRKSLKACRENLNGLKNLPMERVRDEFLKILMTPNAADVLKIMFENNILSNWLADSPYLKQLETLAELQKRYGFAADAVRRIFVLYHPDKTLAENIANRFKLTKRQKERLVRLATESLNVGDLSDDSCRQQTIYRFGKEFCLDCLLIRACESKTCENIEAQIDRINNATVPVFPISGRDIVRCGICGNAQIGAIRERLEKIWLESEFKISREELLSKITL